MKTIYEIAKLANCSPSTVSKALNNSSEISEIKKQEIQEIAKNLKYIPNATAKSLITKSNKLLGVIYREESGLGLSHYFYTHVIEYFRKYAAQKGYDIIFINSNEKMSYADHCIYRGVKGVFLPIYDGHVQKEIHEIIESSIHVVLADECEEEVTSVLSDDAEGAEIACRYLQKLGHSTIYHLAGPYEGETRSLSAERRLRGYIKTVNNPVVHMAKNYSFEAGYESMKKIIDYKNLPTAIFIASDILALGAMKVMNEAGIRVPDDISIVGYDDIPIIHYFTPELTTIRQNKQKIGEESAKILISCLENEEEKSSIPQKTRLKVSLIERNTCKKI